MGNLLKDKQEGKIDALMMLGDHSYNLAEGDERRGDGYMEAFEPVVSELPWLPVIGNHEFYDGPSEQISRRAPCTSFRS